MDSQNIIAIMSAIIYASNNIMTAEQAADIATKLYDATDRKVNDA